ncbi:MAG: hypothetical protein P8J86_05170 [Phycisphaerales bacterium]|nr:hypothetical protein [Phycisphaerales bacterium]
MQTQDNTNNKQFHIRHYCVFVVALLGVLSTSSLGQVNEKDLAQPVQVRRAVTRNTQAVPPSQQPTSLKDGQLFPAPPSSEANRKSRSTDGDGELITLPFEVRPTVLAELTNSIIATADGQNGWIEQPLNTVVAWARVNPKFHIAASGNVVLNDGQHLPGDFIQSEAVTSGHLGWRHPWLGPINIPLEKISSVAIDHMGTQLLSKEAPRQDGDIVFLNNGDLIEGFLLEIAPTIVIEVGSDVVEIPQSQIRAIRMIPEVTTPTGRRVTFRDGTMIDVQELRIGLDGYTKISTTTLQLLDGMPSSTTLPRAIEINSISFDPAQFESLTVLKPSEITSPPTRFYPVPPLVKKIGPSSLLDHIEIQGPVSVTYDLPLNTTHFSGVISLTEQSPPCANVQVSIFVDGQPSWKTTLTKEDVTAVIDIPVTGRQLTFELLEGLGSSTGDRVVLSYPTLHISNSSTK